MNFESITDEKYINYFSSSVPKNMRDDVCSRFLNEMISIAESTSFPMPPNEVAKAVFERLSLNGSITENIENIASDGDILDTLTFFEIYTLLWFVSCRNIMLFNEELYLSFANDGTIGRLLLALKKSNK
jgi:hypothetical protein